MVETKTKGKKEQAKPAPKKEEAKPAPKKKEQAKTDPKKDQTKPATKKDQTKPAAKKDQAKPKPAAKKDQAKPKPGAKDQAKPKPATKKDQAKAKPSAKAKPASKKEQPKDVKSKKRPAPADSKAKVTSAEKKAKVDPKSKKVVKKPTKKKALKSKKNLKSKKKTYLKPGNLRFGRAKKAALDKVLKRKAPKPLEKKEKKPMFIIKPIGGEKNGGTRRVLVKKPPSFYPAEKLNRKHPGDVHNKKSKQRLRASLKPGTVCIILAGLHKGKRVVFLKQLASGLCLVTGPYLINGCPLRRINQIYLIATSTRLRLNKLKVPSRVNDAYFKRIKLNKKTKKDDADIFEKKKEKYTTSKKRYSTQSLVDKAVIAAILRHPESRVLKKYLHTKFLLQNTNYPHQMKF